MTNRPILLVGGGTGGHIFPLVAIGQELDRQKIPFIFVGSKGGREEQIVKNLGWQWQSISAGKWRRQGGLVAMLNNLTDVFSIILGIFQSVKIISRSQAKIIFSKAGYVALPMVIAGWLSGKRVIIHESDAVMGMVNKFSTMFADRVFTAFPPEIYPRHDRRYVQVGIPLRQEIIQAAHLKLPKKARPLILVVGGIQGSSAINRLIRQSLERLLLVADVIHITGEREIGIHQKLLSELGDNIKSSYKPFAYIDRELPYYFRTADLIISRASATTIAEGALFGKAMLLIPLASAAGNHQLANAKLLSQAGAAIFSQEKDLSATELTKLVKELLVDDAKRDQLGQSLGNYFHESQATATITNELTNDKEKP